MGMTTTAYRKEKLASEKAARDESMNAIKSRVKKNAMLAAIKREETAIRNEEARLVARQRYMNRTLEIQETRRLKVRIT